jgi:hypothetical protein
MTNQKYIGIENELKSFEGTDKINFTKDFTTDDFNNFMKGKYYYYSINQSGIRSHTGNKYYVDGNEMEIVTPPIAINKGFASRVTDALILGRNYVIKNTPYLKHTGYSMHWNLTATDAEDDFYKHFYNGLAIPFQLFGLTPMSCGFNIRSWDPRIEILGDSLVSEDQIRATALLLGAYSLAQPEHKFPIAIKELNYSDFGTDTFMEHMLRNGRYTILHAKSDKKNHLSESGRFKNTQAQNILELFYEWLSPFVYKLGERDEIRNLEAFITGEKKLEIDDVKYFHMMEEKDTNNYCQEGIYPPTSIKTPNGNRSPKLHICKNAKVPLEGKLWGQLADKHKFDSNYISWESLRFNEEYMNTNYVDTLPEIYTFLEKVSNLKYTGTLDVSKISPNPIINTAIDIKLRKRIYYNPDDDMSAIIQNEKKFETYLKTPKHTKSCD